ncbi:hypothetical protein [Nonomuraea sp. NPDC050202]|uniref:hypothetical protein n=1 Tax=Nonomuraea sp. NPDC050202 TaxID=3155035 RepID=UPI0033CCE9EC
MDTNTTTRSRLAEEYQAGTTIRELATRHRISQQQVYEALVDAGAAAPPRRQQRRGRLRPQTRQAIVRAYKAEQTIDRIAYRYNVGENTVRRAAAAAGLPPRPLGSLRGLDYDLIQDLAKQGATSKDIAARINSTPGSVQQVRRKLKRAPDGKLPYDRPLSPARRIILRKAHLQSIDIDALAQQHLAGASVRDLAQQHNLTYSWIYRRFHRAGIPLQGQPSKSQRAEIAAAYAEGQSLRDIAAAFGISPGSVAPIARAAGIPPRPTGKPRINDWSHITSLADQGMTAPRIAAAVGCSKRHIARVLNGSGYTWTGTIWEPPAE